ncbi:MAG TPA: MBL fold metallo-hydrolase [Clostridiales bacterium]|nr:MBL fold metallo-hydrolase [Clostridiales bacterium]HQP68929.1 MBL fold metallo-hydrolase [Clostridiales bacterium]
MKITILYDNTVTVPALTPDWGFSCLIETGTRNILFDTGGNGRILLENMAILGIDPASIDDIFISHQHFDHIGGLSAMLNENQNAVVHIPPSVRGIKYKNQVISYSTPSEIYPGIYTTGELNDIEQSMFLDTQKGAVVIIGCCHPGLGNILGTFPDKKISLIVGGLHGSEEYEVMERSEKICPSHCTRHIEDIKSRFYDKYIPGGAGTVIEL